MRIAIRSRNHGSMLVVTVCIALLIGTGLVSYLWLVHTQNRLVSRSLHWNMALAHAEAGVEEALAQLNHKFGTNLDRAANGWGGPTLGVFGPVQRTFSTGRYKVSISTDTLPIIRSTGFATNLPSTNVVERIVEVQAVAASAFQAAIAAKLNIDFSGNNVRIDSYDSDDPAHDDPINPAEVKDGGDIASTDGIVSVQNAIVKGKVRTGPTGSYSVGANGSAGSLSWPDNCGKIEPGWYFNDFNMDFKDVLPDFVGGFAPGGGSGTNAFIFTGGNNYYVNGNFKQTGTKKTLLVQGGVVQFWVTGNFDIPTTWEIKIEPGSTFKVFVGNTTGPNVSGSFGEVNLAPGSFAATFQYYGLPTNDAITWTGNNEFKGTIYAPQATFTVKGGGSGNYDYMGACVVNKVVMVGHFNFHFDEALKKKGPPASFVAGSWREL